MQRRSFFRTLLAAGTDPAWAGTRTTILIQTSPVAGFQYHEGETVWPHLLPGAALDLAREPGNLHDERAVRIDRIGHASCRSFGTAGTSPRDVHRWYFCVTEHGLL